MTVEKIYDNIYQRRDRIWMKYDRRIRKWTARFALDIPVDSLVADILAHTDFALHEAQRDDIKLIVADSLLSTMGMYADLGSEARYLVAAGQSEGTALGATAAAALLAFKAGNPLPNLDVLQTDSLNQLQQSAAFWDHSAEVVQNMIDGIAGDIATGLPPLAAKGASYDDIASYIIKTVGRGSGAAFYMDAAIHSSFALATLASIVSSDVENLISFITVGDVKVCVSCEKAEAQNPWKPSDVPPIPNHGGCRCWYGPA